MRIWSKTAGIAAAAALGLVASAIAAAAGSGEDANAAGAAAPDKPNIVYILTDDMSTDLLPYMAEVDKLKSEGTTMKNFVFGDSLCCPSRATILSGKFPHNTGVLTNTSAHDDGGLPAFLDDEARSIAVQLRKDGYRTGLMGKYMNEYKPQGTDHIDPLYVPKGWNEWHVADGGGYNEMDYTMTRKVDGDKRHQTKFRDPVNDGHYLTDVLAHKAENFLDRAVNEHGDQPFFLEIAPFAPHSKVGPAPDDPYPFVPAPRDRANPDTGFAGDCGPADCGEVRAPREGSFDKAVENPVDWMRTDPLDPDSEIPAIDRKFMLRVQMMQAVDDMIERVRTKLDQLGVAENTYIVFGSDNGFHLGQHRMLNGKGSAFDHDAIVPLIVVGPEVQPGKTRDELVQNVDMYNTFLEMAELPQQTSNGASMLGLLEGGTEWKRDAAFLEHTTHGEASPSDPDAMLGPGNANPGTYTAIRTADELFVKYETGEFEYYDLANDQNQLTNKAAELTDEQRTLLNGWRKDLADCGQGPPTLACYHASQHPDDR